MTWTSGFRFLWATLGGHPLGQFSLQPHGQHSPYPPLLQSNDQQGQSHRFISLNDVLIVLILIELLGEIQVVVVGRFGCRLLGDHIHYIWVMWKLRTLLPTPVDVAMIQWCTYFSIVPTADVVDAGPERRHRFHILLCWIHPEPLRCDVPSWHPLAQLGRGEPSGKRLHNNDKSPFRMGKLTITVAIFNSYMLNYQGNPAETLVKLAQVWLHKVRCVGVWPRGREVFVFGEVNMKQWFLGQGSDEQIYSNYVCNVYEYVYIYIYTPCTYNL